MTESIIDLEATVVHQDIEGGFWGLEGDDGVAYRPVDGLPKAHRVVGQRVHVRLEPVMALSFAMWGRSVRIHEIEAR